MKAFLMYERQDFDPEQELPPNAAALVQDLELKTLFATMSGGDTYLQVVVKTAVLSSLHDPNAILYRQQMLADCFEQPKVVRQIYDIAVDALQAERKVWGLWGNSPESLLHRSLEVLGLLVASLKELRKVAVDEHERFRSEGWTRFFAMVLHELDDDYFQELQEHLRELKFNHGMVMSAELGQGNVGTNYVLRRARKQRWFEQIVPLGRPGYSFYIAERDEAGFHALGKLREQGLNPVANALAQSVDHIRSFFHLVRAELAFYLGCINLRARLLEKGEPICFPVPLAAERHTITVEGLYDVCLSLRLKKRAVGNTVQADDTSLVMITGANHGGKSTFLRSIGLAYLMMHSGMFVAASSFSANVCSGIFTHFKREEDPRMKSGKLDEELSRMSEIADSITPNCLLLCNESFASTNEREGSEIARQVIRAMVESGIKVFFVTHLYDLAHGFYQQRSGSTLSLRAERQLDGHRSFRLAEGEPLPTSYGEDSYRRIFGTTALPARSEQTT
jgi:MutS domain V